MGGKLQLWIDEGKIWQKPKHGAPRLLSYDETPFSYVLEVGFDIVILLFGLFLVWVALDGRAKDTS